MKFGICMEGNEKAFCEALDLAITKDQFVYYEIGVGNGDTLRAVDEYLSMIDHIIIGIDLPHFPLMYRLSENVSISREGAEVFLSNVSHLANFIFVDACHGYECVTRDFLLAEKKIKPGGIIAFHDIDEACQGLHAPQHCGRGIEARRAVKDLGLLDNSRPNWKVISETTGDKSISPAGHGCLFVQWTQTK